MGALFGWGALVSTAGLRKPARDFEGSEAARETQNRNFSG
jgi:hypothetical protein